MSSNYLPSVRDVPRDTRLPVLTLAEAEDLAAPWRDEALCAKLPDSPEKEDEPSRIDFTLDYDLGAIARAQKVCGVCPVKAICLSSALIDRNKPTGVRGAFYFIMGGLDSDQREMVRKLYGAKSRKVPSSH